jgi:uncharacterized protein (TIGR02246 family)
MAVSDDQQVIAVEEALFDALKNRDSAALSKLVADDFQFRDAGNEIIAKPEFLKAATSVPGTILSVSSDDMRVRVIGDLAILSGTQKAVVRLKDGNQLTGEGVFTDVFAKRDGAWQLIFAHNIDLPTKE